MLHACAGMYWSGEVNSRARRRRRRASQREAALADLAQEEARESAGLGFIYHTWWIWGQQWHCGEPRLQVLRDSQREVGRLRKVWEDVCVLQLNGIDHVMSLFIRIRFW